MIRISVFLVTSILTFCLLSCKKVPDEQNRDSKTKEQTEHISVAADISSTYNVLADTISYGVIIKNKDTSDKWQKKWLQNLRRDHFVDQIFNKIYSGELQPYSYFDEKQLSIKDIKSLEAKKEFSRNKIGKVQFKEIWYWNPEKKSMMKEVYSIMFAYERYNSDSTFRGYKPAFKVYLNSSSKNQ